MDEVLRLAEKSEDPSGIRRYDRPAPVLPSVAVKKVGVN